MENSLKESVIKKIQNAKLFLELGKDCFREIENVERVGAGIILLQDSVELFLIAICEQLEVNYNPSKITFNQYFDEIDTDVWEYQIGGYQVLTKWLKDRRRRKLSLDGFGDES